MIASEKNPRPRLVREEDGSATIESLFWIPLLAFFLLVTVDVVLICSSQSRAAHIIQIANRAYAVGTLTSDKETESFIAGHLASISPNATIKTSLSNGIISSYVEMPARDLSSIGLLPNFDSLKVAASAQQLKEPSK